ncbi:hypothetical protein NFI96_021184, partial [Prochilodus magdalenae]
MSWTWSDWSTSSYRCWNTGEPSIGPDEDCMHLVKVFSTDAVMQTANTQIHLSAMR